MEASRAKHAPDRNVVALAGADFYLGVRFAQAMVATSEPRLCATIVIREDVIYPPENRKS
jgi:L-fucose mutarotase